VAQFLGRFLEFSYHLDRVDGKREAERESGDLG
jgi:hypothetical protein